MVQTADRRRCEVRPRKTGVGRVGVIHGNGERSNGVELQNFLCVAQVQASRGYFDSNALIAPVTCGMTSFGTAIDSW